jgi:hypothetical protein
MKKMILLTVFLIFSHNAFSQNASPAAFIGTYHCSGYDPYLDRNYTGTVKIEEQGPVYKMSMEYDTGEKYNATGGQYNEELLSVVFQDLSDPHIVGLEQYHLLDDKKSMGGFWVYLGKNKLGRETCTRVEDKSA